MRCGARADGHRRIWPNRAPFELSGGEKKRAAIASVLSLEPTVLLLDEPTAALDPRTKWVLVNLIRRLGEDRTIVTATHDLDIVPLIAVTGGRAGRGAARAGRPGRPRRSSAIAICSSRPI